RLGRSEQQGKNPCVPGLKKIFPYLLSSLSSSPSKPAAGAPRVGQCQEAALAGGTAPRARPLQLTDAKSNKGMDVEVVILVLCNFSASLDDGDCCFLRW
ncbi:unnamed protein product, partial [Urochloa humidicola]